MNLTAVILAGGVGQRFWPITTNKSLFQFAGRPIIDYVIEDLKAAGINDFIIVANPDNKDKLKSLYPQAKITIQPQPTGMADGILTAKDTISGPLLIINASDLFEPGLFSQVVSTIKADQPQVLLLAVKTDKFLPAGYFKLQGNQPVSIIEKPTLDDKPSNLVRAVIDYFADPKLLFKSLSATRSRPEDGYERSLNHILTNQAVRLHVYSGSFNQLKYPWQALAMMKTILTTRLKPRRDKSTSIHPSAVVDDNVTLESNVKIMAHATVKGPGYIGQNTIIGNNALVRQSIIGPDCVIGYNTEVARSLMGDNCWFHSNYIGDSVLESDVSFGAGALTANLRLDQKTIRDTQRTKLGAIIGQGVRIGVNTSLMPGINLGQKAVVGPGLIIKKDLPEKAIHLS